MRIDFSMCRQDSQEFGSDEEFMVSRLFFIIIPDEGEPQEAHCDIKQVVGSNYADGPLEVGKIVGYRGPVNYEAFRAAAEDYYRQLVGSQAMAIRIEGAANVRMSNNTFAIPMSVEIPEGNPKGAW